MRFDRFLSFSHISDFLFALFSIPDNNIIEFEEVPQINTYMWICSHGSIVVGICAYFEVQTVIHEHISNQSQTIQNGSKFLALISLCSLIVSRYLQWGSFRSFSQSIPFNDATISHRLFNI